MSWISGQGLFPGIRMTFYTDHTGVRSLGEHNILNMHLITDLQNTCSKKTDRTERRNGHSQL